MTTTQITSHRIEDAERPLWLGQTAGGWGDVLCSVDPNEAQDAGSMIEAAGLGWTVEQCPLEAVLAIGGSAPKVARFLAWRGIYAGCEIVRRT